MNKTNIMIVIAISMVIIPGLLLPTYINKYKKEGNFYSLYRGLISGVTLLGGMIILLLLLLGAWDVNS